MQKIIILLLVLMYCPFSAINAAPKQQSLNYSIGIGSPITTATTDTFDKGSWGLSLRSEYYPSKPLSDLQLLQFPDAESQDSAFINYLMLSYGLGDDVTISAALPYSYTSQLRAAAEEEDGLNPVVSQLGNISGVSDLNMFLLFRAIKEDQAPVSVAFLAGINAPVGKTTARTRDGILFAASDQPGTGEWQPITGLIMTKKWDNTLLSGNLIYTQSTEGAQSTNLGAIFDYNIAAVTTLYQAKNHHFEIDGIIELNGEYVEQSTINRQTDVNSGGHSLFLLPGLRANIKDSISGYLGIWIPLQEHYYGLQVKSKCATIAGIDFSFG